MNRKTIAVAAEAGLKPGDRIVALDGRPAKELPVSEARGRLPGAPGTRMRLTLDGRERIRPPRGGPDNSVSDRWRSA